MIRTLVNAGVLAAVLAAALGAFPGRAAVVDARDHRAFWLWAGVRPQPALDDAETVYLMQGEVLQRDGARLASRRPATPHIRGAAVWMVVRTDTFDWGEGVRAQVLRELAAWRGAGNRVVGLQVDFDAASRHLDRYADFLRGLRALLPPDTRLGVTGLLDWSASGDPEGLRALAGTVDEVVVQTYQGRHVIPGYEAYVARLGRMTVPFRIGVVQGDDWTEPGGLSSNPLFRGYVLFLRNGVDEARPGRTGG